MLSNPGISCSNPLGGSKVNSTFHPSIIDDITPETPGDLRVKSNLPLCNSSVAFRLLNSIHENGAIKFLFAQNKDRIIIRKIKKYLCASREMLVTF